MTPAPPFVGRVPPASRFPSRDRRPPRFVRAARRSYRGAVMGTSARLGEMLSFLGRLTDWERMERRGAWKVDLRGIEGLLGAVGRPDRGLAVVHVAGSKGKGSVATITEALARAHGLCTGLYLSPHLVSVCERVRIGGRPLDPDALAGCLEALRAPLELAGEASPPEGRPSFFDAMTAAATLAFARARVDVAVVETGLGGRLDSTSALRPLATAVTRLDLEHREVLGETIEEIAREKAGIFVAGVPAWSAVAAGEPGHETLHEEARARGAPFRSIGEDLLVEDIAVVRGRGVRFRLRTRRRDYGRVEVGLLGRFQATNAALAVALLEELEAAGQLRVNPSTVARTLAAVRIPARVEPIAHDPLVVLDGAHVPASVRLVVEALGENFEARPRIGLFGCAREKDVPGMLRELAPLDRVIVTSVGSPRSASPRELAARAREAGLSVESVDRVAPALDRARSLAGTGGAVLVVGSLWLAGEILRLEGDAAMDPLPAGARS